MIWGWSKATSVEIWFEHQSTSLVPPKTTTKARVLTSDQALAIPSATAGSRGLPPATLDSVVLPPQLGLLWCGRVRVAPF